MACSGNTKSHEKVPRYSVQAYIQDCKLKMPKFKKSDLLRHSDYCDASLYRVAAHHANSQWRVIIAARSVLTKQVII